MARATWNRVPLATSDDTVVLAGRVACWRGVTVEV